MVCKILLPSTPNIGTCKETRSCWLIEAGTRSLSEAVVTGLEAVTSEALVVVSMLTSMLELELVSVEERVEASTTGVALGTPRLVLW